MRKLVAIAIAIISITSITNAVGLGEFVTEGEVKDWYASMSNVLKLNNEEIDRVLEKNTKMKDLHDRAIKDKDK